jgi:hypothetical protein
MTTPAAARTAGEVNRMVSLMVDPTYFFQGSNVK